MVVVPLWVVSIVNVSPLVRASVTSCWSPYPSFTVRSSKSA